MNFLKKGPELKLSELHIPNFVYDIYYDLKERHLLPLAAVLLVAIVAVPIYVKGTAGSEEEVSAPPVASGSSATSGEALTVAKSESGLRDPNRRLKRARALDPFRGLNGGSTSSSGEEAAGAEASSSGVVVPAEATIIGGESSSSAGESSTSAESFAPYLPAESGGAETGGKTRTRYESNAIDVRIVTVPGSSNGKEGKRTKRKPQVRHNLPELTMLPARSTPAVTYMGPSPDGKKALLVVSSDVVSIFGEAKCLVGSESCQLLALEPGFPETFVYGPHERTYRIELLKIRKTLSAKPRRAKLGAPKHKSHKTGGGKNGSGPNERG